MDMLRRLQATSLATPLVLFSYFNVLLQYGVTRLADDSPAAGIDGWLVVRLRKGLPIPPLGKHRVKELKRVEVSG